MEQEAGQQRTHVPPAGQQLPAPQQQAQLPAELHAMTFMSGLYQSLNNSTI